MAKGDRVKQHDPKHPAKSNVPPPRPRPTQDQGARTVTIQLPPHNPLNSKVRFHRLWRATVDTDGTLKSKRNGGVVKKVAEQSDGLLPNPTYSDDPTADSPTEREFAYISEVIYYDWSDRQQDFRTRGRSKKSHIEIQ